MSTSPSQKMDPENRVWRRSKPKEAPLFRKWKEGRAMETIGGRARSIEERAADDGGGREASIAVCILDDFEGKKSQSVKNRKIEKSRRY